MIPRGAPNTLGSSQSIPPSLLRSNSAMLGGQGGAMPSQGGFSSMASPRTQFGNMNMLGSGSNVTSLLHQSFGNGGPNPGLSGPGNAQRGLVDNGAESDPLSSVGNGMGFNAPPSPYVSVSLSSTSNSAAQVQGQQFTSTSGNQMLTDQQTQQLDPQSFQHNQQLPQFSTPDNSQTQQQQFPSMRSGLGGVASVKLEPQVTNDQIPQQLQASQNLATVKLEQQHIENMRGLTSQVSTQPPQHLQALRNLATMKLEPQQLQNMRGLTPVKMEPQHADPSLFIQQHQHQQQQQQQLLQMSRQSPQAAAMAQLLHQQRLMQFQQQQQHQLLKTMPQQRNPLQPQYQPPNMALRSPAKPLYEPGMCARRLTNYMYQQQHRPEDNNIEFWRKFVAEYFAPNAKKKWCVSMYGSGRQTNGVFPQDVWHCEICNRKPGRGFEATVEVLPRLFKIKYESGTLEELLYVDMPCEYQNSSGQIVLDYAKAIQESVFEQLRVVRDGQLRVVFSSELKIVSWEFCARRHEELIPRRLLIPQVSQLGAAAQKYQSATQNASSNVSVSELQNNCNLFVTSARQLAKALEVPLVNDLGYTKRYVRCLQISEVVNSMKDLIDYSRETGTGPMESLAKFPRRTNVSSGIHSRSQHSEDWQHQQQQQSMGQNSNHDSSVQAARMQPVTSNVNSSLSSSAPATTSSTSNIAGLVHQNSMNSRHQNHHPVNGVSSSPSPYAIQMSSPTPSSSSSMPQPQTNLSSFQSPTLPLSNNHPPQSSHGGLSSGSHINSAAGSPNISMPALSGDMDANDSQSSVQKIINEMVMSSQLGGVGTGTIGNDMKNGNGMLATNNSNSVLNGSGYLAGSGGVNAANTTGIGFRNMGNGRSASMNGRVGGGMSMAREQQQDLGNQLLNGLGTANGFNNIQFDWKTSP